MKYGSMTVNERLWESGFYDEFNYLLKSKADIKKIISILKQIELTRRDIVYILKQNDLYSQTIDYSFCMSDGQRADINHDYLAAIDFYEQECESPVFAGEAIPNLVYLYWCVCELNPNPCQLSSLQIDKSIALNRLNSLLDKGSMMFKYNCTFTFWRVYYLTSQIGSQFALSEKQWLMIIERFASLYPPSPDLYFVCYQHNKNRYESIIKEFLIEAANCPTAKNLFIQSQIVKHE